MFLKFRECLICNLHRSYNCEVIKFQNWFLLYLYELLVGLNILFYFSCWEIVYSRRDYSKMLLILSLAIKIFNLTPSLGLIAKQIPNTFIDLFFFCIFEPNSSACVLKTGIKLKCFSLSLLNCPKFPSFIYFWMNFFKVFWLRSFCSSIFCPTSVNLTWFFKVSPLVLI